MFSIRLKNNLRPLNNWNSVLNGNSHVRVVRLRNVGITNASAKHFADMLRVNDLNAFTTVLF